MFYENKIGSPVQQEFIVKYLYNSVVENYSNRITKMRERSENIRIFPSLVPLKVHFASLPPLVYRPFNYIKYYFSEMLVLKVW